MTARITGSIRPTVAYGNAETRQRRIDSDRAMGIRDVEGNTNARAEQRLWGRVRPVPANGNRRVLSIGIGDGGEVSTWTSRTESGALDGATLVRA